MEHDVELLCIAFSSISTDLSVEDGEGAVVGGDGEEVVDRDLEGVGICCDETIGESTSSSVSVYLSR